MSKCGHMGFIQAWGLNRVSQNQGAQGKPGIERDLMRLRRSPISMRNLQGVMGLN